MDATTRDRLARLGPVRMIERGPGGTSAALTLSPARPDVATVSAAISLAGRGVALADGKAAMERMLADGRATVRAPRVDCLRGLLSELAAHGVAATVEDAYRIEGASR